MKEKINETTWDIYIDRVPCRATVAYLKEKTDTTGRGGGELLVTAKFKTGQSVQFTTTDLGIMARGKYTWGYSKDDYERVARTRAKFSELKNMVAAYAPHATSMLEPIEKVIMADAPEGLKQAIVQQFRKIG